MTGLAVVDRLVQPADQLGLVVGLPQVDLDPVARLLGQHHAERRQVQRAVHLGLAAAEPSEVRSVQYQHARHGDTVSLPEELAEERRRSATRLEACWLRSAREARRVCEALR